MLNYNNFKTRIIKKNKKIIGLSSNENSKKKNIKKDNKKRKDFCNFFDDNKENNKLIKKNINFSKIFTNKKTK